VFVICVVVALASNLVDMGTVGVATNFATELVATGTVKRKFIMVKIYSNCQNIAS
jgi:hypothetical protein